MVIRLVTPSSMVLVEAPSTTEKANWLDSLERTIIKHLEWKKIPFDGPNQIPSIKSNEFK